MSKYQVYLDMDGPLADFDAMKIKAWGPNHRFTTAEASAEKHDPQLFKDFWTEVWTKYPAWFLDLPMTAGAKELFEFCVKNFETAILTALPKGNRKAIDVAQQKQMWVRKYIGEYVPVICCYREHKQDYAKRNPNSVLVDDTQSNINEWKAAGGVGIFFRSAEDSIKSLQALV